MQQRDQPIFCILPTVQVSKGHIPSQLYVWELHAASWLECLPRKEETLVLGSIQAKNNWTHIFHFLENALITQTVDYAAPRVPSFQPVKAGWQGERNARVMGSEGEHERKSDFIAHLCVKHSLSLIFLLRNVGPMWNLCWFPRITTMQQNTTANILDHLWACVSSLVTYESFQAKRKVYQN